MAAPGEGTDVSGEVLRAAVVAVLAAHGDELVVDAGLHIYEISLSCRAQNSTILHRFGGYLHTMMYLFKARKHMYLFFFFWFNICICWYYHHY